MHLVGTLMALLVRTLFASLFPSLAMMLDASLLSITQQSARHAVALLCNTLHAEDITTWGAPTPELIVGDPCQSSLDSWHSGTKGMDCSRQKS